MERYRVPLICFALVVFTAMSAPVTGGHSNSVEAQPRKDFLYSSNPIWSPDGENIAFLSNRTGTRDLWLISPDGSNLRQLLTITNSEFIWPPDLVFSPDGQFLAFSSDRSGNYDVWVVSIDSLAVRNLTAIHSGPDWEQSWCPDGRLIAYVAGSETGRSAIWVVAPDGSNPVQLFSEGNYEYYDAAWSPTGDTIAFGAFDLDRSHPAGIWVVNPDNPKAFSALTFNRNDRDISWSPDGKALLTITQDGLYSDIWLIKLDSTLINLTEDFPGSNSMAVWSPMGNRIAFISSRGEDSDVWLIENDGSNPINLTDDIDGLCLNPTWSPNGMQIAFEFHPMDKLSEAAGEVSDIWLMNVDGSGKTNLTSTQQ